MTGDEIDAGARAAAIIGVQVAAAGDAIGEFGHLAGVPAPETPHAIAITPVPFAPVDREVTDLIAFQAHVPRLGDQFHAGQNGVLVQDVKEGRESIHAVFFSRQRGGKVKAEPVHVHFARPVAKTVHNKF